MGGLSTACASIGFSRHCASPRSRSLAGVGSQRGRRIPTMQCAHSPAGSLANALPADDSQVRLRLVTHPNSIPGFER